MESLEIINRLTREAYNKAAQKYYNLFFNELEKKEYDKRFIDEYLEYFNSNSLICDLGCGPCGHIENYLFQKGFQVIGIDISEKCIELAKIHHPKVQLEIGDFSKLKYRENHFDGLIAYYSIIDTPKIYLNKILKEFNRVLKTNGYLLLVVKEGETEGYVDELLGIKTKIYYSLFTEKEVNTFLRDSGFESIRMTKRNPYFDEIQINRIFSISKKVT